MLKKTIFCALVLLSLTACIKHKVNIPAPAAIELTPRQGLVSEPVFNNQVYIKLTGNPSGPVIVLVHGLGDNASNIWEQTVRKLESQYFLVTLDLPGFGQSAKANALYSPENYAELIHYLSQTYIGKPFHLVGHSMGGAITLRYAAKYPQDVETLTLVDAAGILHRLAYTKYLAPLGLKPFAKYFQFDRKDVSSLAGLILSKVENFMQLDPKLLIEDANLREKILRGNPVVISGMALVLDNFSQMPSQVSTPTQIIWGENDEVAPVRTGHVLNALIPNSSLHLIANTGHVPITDKPDAFHQLLLQSITKQPNALETHRDSLPVQRYAHCDNQNNTLYSGTFTKLTINNCKNVLIRDANIEQLVISDSRVVLQNVDLVSRSTALTVKRSNVEITAGSIRGKIGIKADQSRLDIAGTTLISEDATMTTHSTASAIFSLSPRSGGIYQDEILHGRTMVTADSPLL